MKGRVQNSLGGCILFACLCLAFNVTAQTASEVKPRKNFSDYLRFQPALQIQDSNLHLWPADRSTYTDALPLFCKMENQWSQKARLNVRMRVGSLGYVDYLENKNKLFKY